MPNNEERPKKTISAEEMSGFSWGGNTGKWEEEADRLMNILQNQVDDLGANEDSRNKVEYFQRWNFWH